MSRVFALALALVLAALVACDSSSGAVRPVPVPRSAPPDLRPLPPAPAVPPPTPAVAPYDVHEWGLVGVDAVPGAPAGPATVTAVPWRTAPQPGGGGSSPFPFLPSGSGLGKPVLYVHLENAADEVTFRARVTLPAQGTLAEHWPERTLDAPGVVTWSDVRAHRGGCRPRRYPSFAELPCLGRDGCEAAELAKYETSDGACLTTAGHDYDHLFYRGELPTFDAPLALERGAAGAIVARNPTDELIGPFVVRVVVRSGRLSVLVSDAVGEGGEVSIPSPTATPAPRSAMSGAAARAGGIQALVAGLRAAGLTQPEIDAFGRAWWDELFRTTGAGAGRRGHALARSSPPRDELLYWLPQGLADRASVLSFDPRPRAVRRALLVRQAL